MLMVRLLKSVQQRAAGFWLWLNCQKTLRYSFGVRLYRDIDFIQYP